MRDWWRESHKGPHDGPPLPSALSLSALSPCTATATGRGAATLTARTREVRLATSVMPRPRGVGFIDRGGMVWGVCAGAVCSRARKKNVCERESEGEKKKKLASHTRPGLLFQSLL